MNLKQLNDDQVHQSTQTAATNARKATTTLLHHLREVDRRKIFAKKGSSSLFQYCVQFLKMSDPQAARHVNAARMLNEFPELGEKIDSGALCLTTISQIWLATRFGRP